MQQSLVERGKMESDEDDLPSKTNETQSIRAELELKKKELELSLAVVNHALALIRANDDAEEIYHAIEEALG